MPEDFIQTGISTIDIMNTLVIGQKLEERQRESTFKIKKFKEKQ